MKIYYITGVSGTGKSTLTKEFEKRGLNAVDLDSGFCVWRNIKTGEEADVKNKAKPGFYDENDWYCDLKKLNNFLSHHEEPIFIFGACANQDDFLASSDRIFLLKCNPDVFLKRIEARTNNSYGKLPQEKENELRWFQEFNNNMIGKGAIIINAENPIDQVVDEILTKSGI